MYRYISLSPLLSFSHPIFSPAPYSLLLFSFPVPFSFLSHFPVVISISFPLPVIFPFLHFSPFPFLFFFLSLSSSLHLFFAALSPFLIPFLFRPPYLSSFTFPSFLFACSPFIFSYTVINGNEVTEGRLRSQDVI